MHLACAPALGNHRICGRASSSRPRRGGEGHKYLLLREAGR